MAAAVRLREDFDAERLRVLARGSKDAPQARRLLALGDYQEFRVWPERLNIFRPLPV